MAISDLDIQRRRVVERIYADFKGVTREGGVSWSESYVIDDYGDEHERAVARAGDVEADWMALVDDPNWIVHPCAGGFAFMDAIGVRYYLAPAMVRQASGKHPDQDWLNEEAEAVDNVLSLNEDRRAAHFELLSVRQRWCVRAFLQFMAVTEEEESRRDAAINGPDGADLFEDWKRVLAGWTEEWCAAGRE